MKRAPPAPGEVLLCSYGLHWRQITLETLQALRRADAVFADAMDERTAEPLRLHCRKLLLLQRLFPHEGRPVDEILERKVRCVTQAALRGRTVAVVTYGHPMFLCSLTEGLIAACRKERIRVQILHAVSSLGAVLAEVGLNRLPPEGLHVLSAATWQAQAAPLNPKAPALVFDLYHFQGERSGHLEDFLRWLNQTYPARHGIELVRCQGQGRGPAERKGLPLDELADVIRTSDVKACTLFVPPRSQPAAGRDQDA